MRTFKFLLITAVLGILPTSAQQQSPEVTEFRKPGDVLRFGVKFSGPDAEKIKGVSVSFGVIDNKPSVDQTGFGRSFGGGVFRQSSARTFIVEATIPDGVASGDYLVYINVQADSGNFQYVSGNQFQTPSIRVRNDRSFTPPHITVTELKEH